MDANKIREIRIIRGNPRFRHYPEYKESGVEWIGEIPKGWEVLKVKHVGYSNPSKTNPKTACLKDTLVVFLPMERVHTDGTIDQELRLPYSQLKNGYTYFEENDVLIAKVTPCFENGKIVLIKDLATPVGFGSTEFIVIRPNPQKVFSLFLYYILYNAPLRSIGKHFMTSAVGLKRVPTEFVENFRIPIPTYQEQTQIVNFLDHKTQQIDELIRIKERRIELLQAQRTTLINQAVTKGLDRNVEMKPSGVEWIGVIPAHWNAVPLTKYLESIIDYRGRTPEKTEDGRFLVTAKNIRDGQIDYEISQEFTPEDEYERIMTRGIPQIGDVLFTTEAPLGEVANVDDVSIALAQRIIKFRPKPDFLNPYFLKYWILSYSFQSDLQRYATGSTAKGIKASKLCLLKLNLPPLKEQKQIANFLDHKTKQIDELIAAELRKIELLKEYRQSLISEAVTGKIDVRNEV